MSVLEGPRYPQAVLRPQAGRPIHLDSRSAQAWRPAHPWVGLRKHLETDLPKRSAGGRRKDGPQCHPRRVT